MDKIRAKRIRLLLTALMILCLSLFSLQAQADESTEHKTEMGISGSYIQQENYTVTIPSELKLTKGEASTADISVEKGTNIAVGHRLNVRLKQTDSVTGGQLTLSRCDSAGEILTGAEADTLKIMLQRKSADDEDFIDIKGNEPIASYSDLADEKTTIGTLRLAPPDSLSNIKAGTYKGTVVFTISIESAV